MRVSSGWKIDGLYDPLNCWHLCGTLQCPTVGLCAFSHLTYLYQEPLQADSDDKCTSSVVPTILALCYHSGITAEAMLVTI
jgi:hypothetical protein